MPRAGFDSPSIWHSGWPKPQRRCRRCLSLTKSCWPPSNCHCRTATLLTGFSLAPAQVMDLDSELMTRCRDVSSDFWLESG